MIALILAATLSCHWQTEYRLVCADESGKVLRMTFPTSCPYAHDRVTGAPCESFEERRGRADGGS